MSKPIVRTSGEFFTAVKKHIEATCKVTISEDARLDGLCSDESQLHSDRAKHALKTTARIAFGRGHRMSLHSYTEADKVAAQIIAIAKQRHTELKGKVDITKLLSHAYAIAGFHYLYGKDDLLFTSIVMAKQSPFPHPTEIPVLI